MFFFFDVNLPEPPLFQPPGNPRRDVHLKQRGWKCLPGDVDLFDDQPQDWWGGEDGAKIEWNGQRGPEFFFGDESASVLPLCWKMELSVHLEPQTAIYKWLFQLDDSKSLCRKWLFHQTSIYKCLFGVPGTYGGYHPSYRFIASPFRKLVTGPTLPGSLHKANSEWTALKLLQKAKRKGKHLPLPGRNHWSVFCQIKKTFNLY